MTKPKEGKTVGELVSFLEKKAPSGTAENWDNVGLLVGNPAWKTDSAIVSIDLTLEAIKTAKLRKSRLIVIHHPCIFPKSKGISRVVIDEHLMREVEADTGSLVALAMQNRIAVVACHTNFDQCALEVVTAVSEGLGLKPKGRLLSDTRNSLVKLVVFVPATHLEAVRMALTEAGAGHIGNYDTCTFSVAGEGTFRGSSDTDPFIGKPGKLEQASELRLETIFPRGLQKSVLEAMFAAHPYEEVAFDLYPVEQGPSSKGIVRGLGYGFWGEFSKPKRFSEVVQSVKHLFKLNGFWVTNPSPSHVRRVAFVAGKGTDFVSAASKAKCDLFITGEAGYHAALGGKRRGIAVMELGHRESESFFLSTMKGWLRTKGIKPFVLNSATQRIWR